MRRRTKLATTLALVGALSLGSTVVRADAVLDWNAIMVTTTTGMNPFVQARVAAITQVAVFEAVNAITGKYEPYLGTIDAQPGASADAAAAAAAHGVLKHYVPAAAAGLDEALAVSLLTVRNESRRQKGVEVGEAAAAALIALRANDGSAPPQFHVPASLDPGVWQPTASCPPAGGALLHWRNVTPFGIESSDQFRSAPPPALSSAEYARSYDEVAEVGGVDSVSRPRNRADVARFYAAVLAVGTWNSAVRQVAASHGRPVWVNARAFALLNMAISDGLITVMETKYHYELWRPETAIPRGDEDGNEATSADPAFAPYVVTPCFPSYPSAHATASYAARTIAERIFGDEGHSIELASAAVPGVVLTYSSFEQITKDIDDARVYGGIHFRFDQTAGARQGRQVGDYLLRNVLRRAADH